MGSTRYVEMYSLVKWDKELRTSFCLGYDPYYFNERTPEGIAADKARQLLGYLGVFYYRDIENRNGVRTQPEVGDRHNELVPEGQIIFKQPLICYFYNVKVLYPSIRPVDYIQPENYTKAKVYRGIIEKWGDTKQWLCWGTVKSIVEVTDTHIRHEMKKEV